MTNIDERLERLLSEEDEQFIADALDETGYYSEVISSLRRQGSAMNKLTWIGIFGFCAILFFCIWKFFHAETVQEQIMFAALAIMSNSAQIALKIWYNMRLNRRAIIREIKRMQLVFTRGQTE